MINKNEYNKVVNMYFEESPYSKYDKSKINIIIDFLGDFLREHSFLIETNKTYKNKEFSKLIRKYNNGITYEENGDNIKIKKCVDWKKSPYLKADLIFYSYICKNYNFKIKKTHFGVELVEAKNTFYK